MRSVLRRAALLAALVLACGMGAGCDDDDASVDGGDDGGSGADLAVPTDGGAPPDLTFEIYDLTCVPGAVFSGFLGTTAQERRFNCSCGCVVDPFDKTQVSGVWNTSLEGATLTATASGLEVTPDGADAGVAFGALGSIKTGEQFFLEGDFDLLVDYTLETPIVEGGSASLQVNNLKSPASSIYTVLRQKEGGVDEYTAELAGILPRSTTTSATSGTLELSRAGFVITAIADGSEVSKYTGAVTDRMAIFLSAGMSGSPGASFTVRWRNLRLKSGMLVDRQ